MYTLCRDDSNVVVATSAAGADAAVRNDNIHKYVSGDWRLSTRADPTSRDILQRTVCVARALDDSPADFGLFGEQSLQNGRFPAWDADEPPCTIWRC